MKRILLVIPSSTYRTHDFMQAAGKIGAEVVVASDHRQAMAPLIPDTTVALNFRKPETLGAKMAAFVEKRGFGQPPFAAVVGVDDTSAYIAGLLAQKLGIRHNPPAALRSARNKFAMRQKIAAAGLNYPDFRLFSINENPKKLAKRSDYPCVLKPIFLSGSRGVTRADNPEQFIAAFQRIQEILTMPDVQEKAYDDEAKSLLVEKYIPGVEVALEGMLINREFKTLTIFDKPDPLDGPHFVETIYVTPSRLPGYVLREVTHAAHRAALALGLENGPVHAEMRINDNGVFVIEIAARSICGLCSRMLRFDGDITLEELILRQAIGENIWEIQRERPAAGVMMIPIPKAGTLKAIHGIADAKATPGVEDVIITIPTGQQVLPMPFGGRYLGFIFARDTLPEDAESTIRESFSKLEIEFM